MKALVTFAILAAVGSVPVAAQRSLPPVSSRPAEPDRATKLRCGAAFMIVLDEQQRGIAAMKRFPAMEPRGRRYFEYVMAGEMQERKLDKAGYMALAKEQIEALQKEAIEASDASKFVDGVMQKCLPILDAKFPPE
jgi:hypothetical protein